MNVVYNIESFPAWDTTPVRRSPRIDWVTVGPLHEIALLMQLWSRILQYRLHDTPESDCIAWDLTDVLLQGYDRDTVRINDGMIQIDRRQLAELRDQAEWLYDALSDEHADDVLPDVQQVTDYDDACRVVPVIESIRDIAMGVVLPFERRA